MKALTTSLVAALYAAMSVNAMAADNEETVPAPADANLAEPAEISNTSGSSVIGKGDLQVYALPQPMNLSSG